jgi:hypothetical protein
VDLVLRFVMQRGFRRFREGDHFAWAVIAACAYLLRRTMRPEPPATLVIGRDDRLVISAADAPAPSD